MKVTEMKIPKELQFGYHRTWDIKNVASIAKGVFIPGSGMMYGKGAYLCTNIEAQFCLKMCGYGSPVIKFEMLTDGILFFNYDYAKKVFGNKHYTLMDQLLEYKVFGSREAIPPQFVGWSKLIEKFPNTSNISACVAGLGFVSGYKASYIEKNLYAMVEFVKDKYGFINKYGDLTLKGINGIQFTGNGDNDVYCVYNAKALKPLQYAEIDLDFVKNHTIDEINWNDINDYGVNNVDDKYEILKALPTFLVNSKGVGWKNEDKLYSLSIEDFDKKFGWLKNVVLQGGTIYLDENNNICLERSTVKKGDLFFDKMENCVVTGGRFLGGSVNKTFWKGGVFAGKGKFENSTWGGGSWCANPETWYNSDLAYTVMRYMTKDDSFESTETPDLIKNYKPRILK